MSARYQPPARYRYPYGPRRRATSGEKITGATAGLLLAGFLAHSAVDSHAAHAAAAKPVPAAASPGLSTVSANTALGQRLATAYGWGAGTQWTCLDALWSRESGWRMVWNYQGSGAYGIPQALPASKMASAGADYMTDPATQIRWGLGNIASVYGSPCTAWVHETADGWY